MKTLKIKINDFAEMHPIITNVIMFVASYVIGRLVIKPLIAIFNKQ